MVLITVLKGEEWVLIEKDRHLLSESWDLGVCSNLTEKELDSLKDAYGGYTFRLMIGPSVRSSFQFGKIRLYMV